MTDEQIEALATFFTGSTVAVYSIALELKDTAMSQAAKDFFAARKALGLEGYINKDEAVAAMKQARVAIH